MSRNYVAKIIHAELCKMYGHAEQITLYYRYIPKTIVENGSSRIYWDRNVLIDRTVHSQRPDICLSDKVNKKVLLINVAIPTSANIGRKHKEKIDNWHSKYRKYMG